MFVKTCKRLEFPEAATDVLTDGYERIRKAPDMYALMKQAQTDFVTPGADPQLLLRQISNSSGIHLHTVTAITLVDAVEKMQQVYAEKGYPEAMLWETLTDLKCKLQESYDTDGFWGVSAISWYQRLYSGKILKIGRLEYEIVGYKWDTSYMGVQKDDPILNIHIPSCGALPMVQVMDSLRQAYGFFRKEYGDVQTYVCSSWLLYPPMRERVFPESSNLSAFFDLFDMVESREDPENKDFWRVFHMDYSENILDKVPLDTTLRRNLHLYMREGKHMGLGRGAFRFDGEKMLHR